MIEVKRVKKALVRKPTPHKLSVTEYRWCCRWNRGRWCDRCLKKSIDSASIQIAGLRRGNMMTTIYDMTIMADGFTTSTSWRGNSKQTTPTVPDADPMLLVPKTHDIPRYPGIPANDMQRIVTYPSTYVTWCNFNLIRCDLVHIASTTKSVFWGLGVYQSVLEIQTEVARHLVHVPQLDGPRLRTFTIVTQQVLEMILESGDPKWPVASSMIPGDSV